MPGVKLGIRKPRDLGQQNQCVREELNSDVVFLFFIFLQKGSQYKSKAQRVETKQKKLSRQWFESTCKSA